MERSTRHRSPRFLPPAPRVLFAVVAAVLVALLVAPVALAERPVDKPAPSAHRQVVDLLSGPAFLSTPEGRATVEPPFEYPHDVIYENDSETQRISAALVTGPAFTKQVSNDTNQDTETAIQSLTLSNGTVRTTTTYIKFVNIGGFTRARNYYSTTTNFNTWSSGQLPVPTGYVQTADPLMDSNIYSSGVAPLRMYTVGIVYQATSFSNPNAIGVWRSDNGGSSWSGPTLAATNTSGYYFLDKPDIAVSWYSGTRGYVYVAYVKIGSVASSTQLYVARSTNGGVSFGTPALVTTGYIQGAQIAVNGSTGAVYVSWVDFSSNAIRFSSSSSAATTWSTPTTVATGNLVPPGTYLAGNVRATTLPMMRWNWVTGKLVAVWHEYEYSGASYTDVYYQSWTPAGSLGTKTRVNSAQLHDQFMPSIDFDTTGNMLVMFYDRYRDILALYYEESWSYINSGGSILANGYIGLFSDPNKFGNKFIGDYQDNWWWTFSDTWGNRFNGVWVNQPYTGQGDIYVTGIK